jgi:hypothetical protein
MTVQFSLAAGLPTVPENDPTGASPQGIAIRFHLADHVHTDIVSHWSLKFRLSRHSPVARNSSKQIGRSGLPLQFLPNS